VRARVQRLVLRGEFAVIGSGWAVTALVLHLAGLVLAFGVRSWVQVRNPVFTGMAVVSAGMVLMVPTLVALLALACLVTAVQVQVRVVEEPYLRRVHGDAYRRYAASAGRFLPGLGRWTTS
jgi:hypothetical protein